MVTANFLSLLGVAPQAGRDFVPADGRPGSAAVALLSDALWRERFSGDPRVVGTALDLDGEPYTVAGVLPRASAFPIWRTIPQVLIALETPDSSAFRPGKADHSVPGAGAGAPGILPGRGPRGHRVVPGDQAPIVPRAHGAHGRRTQTGSHSLAAPPRGRFADAADGLAGSGRLGAADRLRQYRQPATGPGGCAPARSGGPGRVGRGTPAPGAAVPHRKHDDLRVRGFLWGWRSAHWPSMSFAGGNRRRCRGSRASASIRMSSDSPWASPSRRRCCSERPRRSPARARTSWTR